jgi:hypothetical protein
MEVNVTEADTQAPDEVEAAPDPYASLNLEQLSGMYVALRDKMKVANDAHKAKMAPANEMLERFEGYMIQRLMDVGADSVKTPAGTVYKTVKKSATISDGDHFREYVIDNEAWHLADWRANPVEVAGHIAKYEAPPPGVNYTTITEVGVRRPAKQ